MLWNLSALVVWHRDHGAVVHGGVREEMGFQLSGSDLVALGCVSLWKETKEDGWMSYLDLDQLLQAIHHRKVFVTLGRLDGDNLIARTQPSAVLIPDKRLAGGLLVVEISQGDGWRLEKELAGLSVFGHLLSILIDDLGSDAGEERARGALEDVFFAGGDDDGGALGKAWLCQS